MTALPNNPLAPPATPPRDGRQSQAAGEIYRGVARLLRAHGLVALPEVTLPTGRRADVIGLSAKGEVWIVEIKSSPADLHADSKWPEYLEFCDRFYFAVSPDFPLELIPSGTGLLLADRFGGDLVREATETALAPARRKAMTLRLARIATERLALLHDPDLASRADAFSA